MSRKRQSICLAFAIVGGIGAILLISNIAPIDRHCAWQFPKVASCLLSARETLASGLIAAGGALFAAWVAWSAVRGQIEFEAVRDASAQKQARDKLIQDTKSEIIALKASLEQLSNFLAAFAVSPQQSPTKTDLQYVDTLWMLSLGGETALFTQPLPVPFQGKVSHINTKFILQAGRIDPILADPKLRLSDAPAAVTPQLHNALRVIDHLIKLAVEEANVFAMEIKNAIKEREALLAEADKELR